MGIDIESLLSSSDIGNSISELYVYVCQQAPWDNNLDRLTEQQKNFYYIQELETEVNNGGFNQYFSNTSGDYAMNIVQSLHAIGAVKTAAIVQKAIDQFPNGEVPTQRAERQNILEQIEDKAEPYWCALEDQFYLYEEDLNSLNMEYVRRNVAAFK